MNVGNGRPSNVTDGYKLYRRTDLMTALVNGTAERIAIAIPRHKDYIDGIMQFIEDGVEHELIETITIAILDNDDEIPVLWRFRIDWKAYELNVSTNGKHVELRDYPRRRKKRFFQEGKYEELATKMTRKAEIFFDMVDRYLGYLADNADNCICAITFRQGESDTFKAAASEFTEKHSLQGMDAETNRRMGNYRSRYKVTLGAQIENSLRIEMLMEEWIDDDRASNIMSFIRSLLPRWL